VPTTSNIHHGLARADMTHSRQFHYNFHHRLLFLRHIDARVVKTRLWRFLSNFHHQMLFLKARVVTTRFRQFLSNFHHLMLFLKARVVTTRFRQFLSNFHHLMLFLKARVVTTRFRQFLSNFHHLMLSLKARVVKTRLRQFLYNFHHRMLFPQHNSTSTPSISLYHLRHLLRDSRQESSQSSVSTSCLLLLLGTTLLTFLISGLHSWLSSIALFLKPLLSFGRTINTRPSFRHLPNSLRLLPSHHFHLLWRSNTHPRSRSLIQTHFHLLNLQ
jgi:hypothetical protein